MAKRIAPLLPATDELLRQLGDRLRLARLRRRLPAKQVAERAGMVPMTLRSLERGSSGVTMGAYLAVMQVLGIEKDLDLLGKADPMGRDLQDAQLPGRSKATRSTLAPTAQPTTTAKQPQPDVGNAVEELRKLRDALPGERIRRIVEALPETQLRKDMDRMDARDKELEKLLKPLENAENWLKRNDFSSSEELARLIDPMGSLKKKVR